MRSSLRARLAMLAPEVARGLRAALTIVVPVTLASAYHRPELAWVALGGWCASLADPGGARRTRARAAVACIIFGGAAVALAAASSATTAGAALALAAITFAASLARSLGATATGVGTSIAIGAAVAAASRPVVAWPAAAALFAAGGVWAALSSTITWPVWRHLPLRLALGRAFERLAAYVEALETAEPDAWAEVGRVHQRAVRGALEEARATALALRARHSGESAAGSSLRVLVGAAESLFFRVIALSEHVESGGRAPAGLAAALRAIARDLYTRRAGPAVALGGRPDRGVVAELVDETREAAEVARDLDRPPAAAAAAAAPLAAPARALRDTLSPRGPIVRYGLRVAATAAASLVAGRALTPSHPAWVTVTTLVVLQPHLGSTLVLAVERVIGTVLGAAVAVAAMASLRSPTALTAAIFPLAVAAMVTRPRSYRLFVLFLTPVFVLLADFGHGDWSAAGARIVDVVLGGAIALAGALIAPSPERERLPEAVAASLAAVARYVQLAAGAGDRRTFDGARRAVGLALEAAEASLERMLAEPPALRAGVEDSMFLVTYARRLAAGVTALLESGGRIPPEVAAYLDGVLADARAHVAGVAPTANRATPHAPSPALARLVRRGELIGQVGRHG